MLTSRYLRHAHIDIATPAQPQPERLHELRGAAVVTIAKSELPVVVQAPRKHHSATR